MTTYSDIGYSKNLDKNSTDSVIGGGSGDIGFTDVKSTPGGGTPDATLNSGTSFDTPGGAVDGGAFTDLWISNTFRSKNYKPKTQGFLLDGIAGYIEAMDLYISGSIIGGSISIPNATSVNSWHVDSNGNMWSGAVTYNITTNPFAVSSAGALRANSGIIGGFTITSTALYGGIIKTATTVGVGTTGVIMDTAGLRGYDSVLGNTFNLPTDGSAPTFASGIINYTTFNINTNAVIRTSATVGDGTVNSAGILINNTGLYATEISQLLTNANIKILVDGSVFIKGDITITNPEDINTSDINNDAGWTDDSSLNTFISDVYTGDISGLQSQIDGQITTWFYAYAPTLANIPASDWTTDSLKNDHLGDLFYDTTTGYVYRFLVSGGVYSWQQLSDSDIAAALLVASNAQDTADAKRRVFTATPTTPYDVGDLWLTSLTDLTGDLKKCTTARASEAYQAGDWLVATKYTDDTVANSKTVTFLQDAIPISLAIGDLWVDTNDLNKLYRAASVGADAITAGEWILVELAGGAKIFAQDAIPTSIAINDLWYDTNDGNKLYKADSVGADAIIAGEWVAVTTDFANIAGATKPADNATVGATWGVNLGSIPAVLGAPSGTGLFLGATNLGYYTGGAWKTYIDNTGNLLLGDIVGGNTGMSWNQAGGTLTIKGTINATAGYIGDSSARITLDSTGLLIGTTGAIRTADTGARISLLKTATGAYTHGIEVHDTSDNLTFRIMADGGNKVVVFQGTDNQGFLQTHTDSTTTQINEIDMTIGGLQHAISITTEGTTERQALAGLYIDNQSDHGRGIYIKSDTGNINTDSVIYIEPNTSRGNVLELTAVQSGQINQISNYGFIQFPAYHHVSEFDEALSGDTALASTVIAKAYWIGSGTSGTQTLIASDSQASYIQLATTTTGSRSSILNFNRKVCRIGLNSTVEFRFYIDNVTNTTIKLGLYYDATHYVYFLFNTAIDANNVYAARRNVDAETRTDTNYDLSANSTWRHFKIALDMSTASALFYINESLVATVTTNFPIGADLTPYAYIDNKDQAENKILSIDSIEIWNQKNNLAGLTD